MVCPPATLIAEAAKAAEGSRLDIGGQDCHAQSSGAFTDYFLICNGTNPRQVQAISDEVELRLKRSGLYPNNIEGHRQGEWVLIDYVDFVVHIFSETARKYYDLERLWKSAKKIDRADFVAKPRKRAVARTRTKKPA